MIKRLFILIVGILGCACALQASEADKLIDRISARLNGSQALKAAFTIAANGQTQQGSILLQGQRFHAETPGMSTWYDGTTQWTLIKQAKEVDITEPTPEELAQVNPFAIINSVKRQYKAQMGKDSGKAKTIILTPKTKASAYSKIVITTQAADPSLPAKISVSPRRGAAFTVAISKITVSKPLDAANFRFNSKRYPGFEIVDLR